MKTKSVALSMATFVCLLFASAAFAQWVDIKDPNELRALYSNKTFKGTIVAPGQGFTAYYRDDGQGVLVFGVQRFPRTWAVVGDDQVCVSTAAGTDCWQLQKHASKKGEYAGRRTRDGALIQFSVADGIPPTVFAQVPRTPTGTALTGAELMKMFERGAILDGQQAGGGLRWTVVLSTSGLLAYLNWLFENGSGGQDRGTWRIVEDTYCSKWDKSRGGKETCFRHYRVGDNAYESWFAAEGNFDGTYRLRQ